MSSNNLLDQKELELELELYLEQKELELDIANKRIIELERRVEELKNQLNQSRWFEIYDFFLHKGIKQTAKQFDMTIAEVMFFIVSCDDCEDGLQRAKDYKECYNEINGLYDEGAEIEEGEGEEGEGEGEGEEENP